MRVLHVTPYFAPAFTYGGPPRSILGLCQGLLRTGVDVSVFTTSANGKGELAPAVADTDTYGGVPVRYFARSFPKRHFRSRALLAAFRAAVGTYDLVHQHGCWNLVCWETAQACRAERVPYVASPRGMLEPWSFSYGRNRKLLAYALVERRRLRSAAAIHATAAQERENIRRLGLARPTVVIPNGVDSAEFEDLPDRSGFRARHGIGSGEFVVLCLGRIHPKKGLEVLGEAFELVLGELPSARLVVAGEGDAGYVSAMRRRFGRLVDSGRWVFAGHLEGEDRLAAYAASDVFALASHSENFGLVIAEAMAAGLPVVLSRQCPWPQVEQWDAGLRVRNEPGRIAAAILTLARDKELRRRMGRNGRRGVRETFDWLSIAGRMRQLYTHVLERAGFGSEKSERVG